MAKTIQKFFSLEWAFDPLVDADSFFTKRMFGGLAAYAFDRLVMVLCEDPGDRTWKKKKYAFEIWNGILFPTEKAFHADLMAQYPALIPHPVLAKWLYLPVGSDTFEEDAISMARLIAANDPRLGVAPTPKKKKLKRCAWPGENKMMLAYHDKEWGRPVHKDKQHFEFLILEAAQAGLSWAIVLKKRPGYRKAFCNFDVKKVARFTPKHIRRLLKDPGIIRNRLKIEAAVNNAKCFIEVQKEFGSFDAYAWRFVGGRALNFKRKTLKDIPTHSPESDAFSRDLKKRGFKFVGTTVIYAHMQAVGMVNDHVVDCFCHRQVGR